MDGSLSPGRQHRPWTCPGCTLRVVENLGSGTDAAPAPSDWMLHADSSLTAFLRMLADVPDPDTVAASIAQGTLSAFRPIVTAIGFIHLDRQVLSVVGTFGREPAIRHLYAAVPLDIDIPATVCFRTNAVVTTPSARLALRLPPARAVRELRRGASTR